MNTKKQIKPTCFLLDRNILKELKILAAQKERTITSFIEEAVKEIFKKYRGEQK